ncbi:site-specific integrase [Bradyrhizobium manausense]
MPHGYGTLVAELNDALTRQRYNRVAVHNYCRNADYFLAYLAARKIALEAVTPADVTNYLRFAVRQFRKHHARAPARYWIGIPRSGIHALLKLALKRWPPEPAATDAGERLCREVCDQYHTWLREERGLAMASVDALLWEARNFCAWLIKHSNASFADLTVRDLDIYMDMRARALKRKSLKDVAERLRSLLKHLHRTGRIAVDLSQHIIAPLLYAYEGIPSALSSDQISIVLEFVRKDRSPMGLRDHAILQLLAVYGLRAGEIIRLRLEDVDWRRDVLHIRRSKTGDRSRLPLFETVGEALIDYLRHGRPETDAREIFVRTRAPYVPMVRIYSEVSRRIEAAGITLSGKRGPHIFRHARAVSLLRASVPRKLIGDVLGHRSMESTIPYLKLATEDLRAIALEIPGQEVRS